MTNEDRKNFTQRKKEREKEFQREEIKQQIDIILTENEPKTIRELVKIMEEKYDAPEELVLEILRKKEVDQDLTLQEPQPEPTALPTTIKNYLFQKNYFSIEFWITIGTIVLVLILTLVNVQEGVFFYIRYIVVTFFMLILSGWTFTAVIFPELDSKLRFLERAATAIGMSIVVLVLDGLFLNYTFGLNLIAISLSLTFLSLLCVIISMVLRLKLARDGFIFKKSSGNNQEKIIES
ncbi:MAG: DUF1616 domain-containing protein [Candidatus Heimdallarchaeota archaeon]|nr:DUF1616 domain-containing protein [Candidatus Heimdallarchaeota archaeon]